MVAVSALRLQIDALYRSFLQCGRSQAHSLPKDFLDKFIILRGGHRLHESTLLRHGDVIELRPMTNLPGGMRRKTFVEDSDDDDYQMAPGINSSQVKRNQISVMTIDDFVR